jgi:hypothetical protein
MRTFAVVIAIMVAYAGAETRATTPNPRTIRASRGIATRSVRPNPSWRLAFTRDDSIWLANGDGSRPHVIIRNASQPSWSPDRKRIAFARGHNVWVANANGSRQRPLTHLPKLVSHERNPQSTRDESGLPPWVYGDDSIEGISWGPGANRVTFATLEYYDVARTRNGDRDRILGSAIYDVPAGGAARSAPRVWFDVFDDDAYCAFTFHTAPAWSARGDALAFARNGDVWLSKKVTDPNLARMMGRVPLDTRRIAAIASYDAPNYRGSREDYHVTRLSWSRDKRWLAYGVSRVSGSGFQEVHVLSPVRQQEAAAAADRTIDAKGRNPCISPDGRLVAYYHEGAIWCCPLGGTLKRKLIDNADYPAW